MSSSDTNILISRLMQRRSRRKARSGFMNCTHMMSSGPIDALPTTALRPEFPSVTLISLPMFSPSILSVQDMENTFSEKHSKMVTGFLMTYSGGRKPLSAMR